MSFPLVDATRAKRIPPPHQNPACRTWQHRRVAATMPSPDKALIDKADNYFAPDLADIL